MAEEDLKRNAPSRDARFEDRVKRLIRPDELKSDSEMPWAGGRGTDVWETITAAIHGDLGTIQQLVGKDPRLANCSSHYRSPLHFAVQENQIEVVKFLLEHGADATYRSGNPWHERPTVIAEERGYRELKELLEAHLEEAHGSTSHGQEIFQAIRERDLERLRRLLAATPSLLETLDERGNRPIHWAALVRSTEITELLLDRGADINVQRPDGARPLDLTNGDYWFRKNRDVPKDGPTQEEMSRFLIDRGATYDITAAAKLGDIARVRALVNDDPSLVNHVPDYCTYYNGVPLWEAVSKNQPEIVQHLLDAGADPSTPEPGMAPKGRVLMSAVKGDLKLVRDLLERGADPNGGAESSGTAMSAAINRENWDALSLMASYGGQIPDYTDLNDVAQEGIEAVYGTALPLKYYVDTEDTETLSARFAEDASLVREALHISMGSYLGFREKVLRLCLDWDPDGAKTVHCNELINKLGRIEEEKLLDPFRWLLEAGMTPNDPNWMRVTPLHLLALGATHHGTDGREYRPHPKMMTLFIEHGADLDARDRGGVTALHMAVRDRDIDAVRALLEHGAAVDIEDRGRKSTPLRRAVANTGKPGTSGRQNVAVEITAILLDHGADPKHVNRSGKPMLASTRHARIRALLEAAIRAG